MLFRPVVVYTLYNDSYFRRRSNEQEGFSISWFQESKYNSLFFAHVYMHEIDDWDHFLSGSNLTSPSLIKPGESRGLIGAEDSKVIVECNEEGC